MQPINLAQQRLEANRSSQSPFLDLGNCGLTQLPAELASFEWLEDINLGTVYWDETLDKFVESAESGPNNQLSEENFSVLQGLPKLGKLSARSANVRNLAALAKLPHLRSLSLGGNDIRNISPLAKLRKLHTLSLFDNALENIAPLEQLVDLKILSLNYNNISDIRPLSKLTKLEELHLAGNAILDIQPLEGLDKLFRLNLSSNQLRLIRPLMNLPALRFLSLDRNPVEDCPPEIAFSGDVERLRAFFHSLDKSYQESVGNAPSDSGEAQPTTEDNQPIPEVKLILVGNPTSGKTSLSRVLRRRPFNERENTTHGIQIREWIIDSETLAGILPENAPKTRLRVNIWDFGGQEYYHGTHQIFLDNNAVYLLLWETAHDENGIKPTAVFLDGQPRTLPMEHFHHGYWLDNIRFHASGATAGGKPPLFMVQNKIDLDQGRAALFDPALLNRYEVINVAGISAKLARSRRAADRRYRYGFEIFREDLLRTLYEKASANARIENLPATWVQLRRQIRDLRAGIADKNNPFVAGLSENAWLTFDDFAGACRVSSPQLTDPEVETLAFYLHQIGAVVWLPHIDRKVYTDPAWLTEKIYRVLNERVRDQSGRFTTAEVRADLRNPAETDLLLRLMQEWEIIFPADPDKGAWVAPQYLPDEHPMENLFRIALTGLQEQFFMVRAPLFHYRKMLRRLIFRYGNDPGVGEKEYWKHGILFVSQTSRLRVFLKGLDDPDDPGLGRLMICVERGKPDTDQWRQRILTDLLAVFLDNRRSVAPNSPQPNWFNNPGALRDEAEKRPELELSLDGREFIPLPMLVLAARNGLSAIVSPGSRQRIRLQEFAPLLLGLQFTPAPPTIFFSYAHEDKPLRDELDKHLAPLRRLGRALSWYDGEIGAGQNWEDSIRRSLRSADIVLLLISSSFLNSNFIWENELLPALERHDRGECRVIPVLLKPCVWQDMNFARLQMLPSTTDTARLQAVTLWRDTDEAYATIVQGIQRALKELKIE